MGTSLNCGYILQIIEFHALGAVKEREEIRKLHREKGVIKCSGALVPSGLLKLNKTEMGIGRLPFRNASRMTMFCSTTKSVIFKKLYLTNNPLEGKQKGL